MIKLLNKKKEIRLNILREDFSNVKKEQLKLKIKENINFLLNIDKIAKNLIKIDYEKNLEAKLFDIVQKDSILFEDDENESKAQYIFSFEEFKNTSLNNLKKIFFNFFFEIIQKF